MAESVRERLAWVDWAKTICIFLMVVGHWTSNNTLLLYIYSFHMPALFVISGYLYKPHSWMKTILSFGIPVAFFSIINMCFLLVIGDIKYDQLLSKEIFFRFFHYRYGLGEGFYCGDWFLWALLGLRLLYGDISMLSPLRKFYLPLGLIVVIYMTLESHLVSVDTIFRGAYIGRLIPSMPFSCLGFLLKDRNWKPVRLSLPIMFLLGVMVLIMPMINGGCSINSNSYGLSYSIFVVFASVMTCFLFELSGYLPMSSFVTVISKGTLLVLGLHIPMMKVMDLVLPSFLHEFLPIMVLPLCYYPILWLDKKCPVLLGKVSW